MIGVSEVEAVNILASGINVHINLPVAQLVERSLVRGESSLAANGALVAYTGLRTGRSPKDKFTVDDATTHAKVDWGASTSPSPVNSSTLC